MDRHIDIQKEGVSRVKAFKCPLNIPIKQGIGTHVDDESENIKKVLLEEFSIFLDELKVDEKNCLQSMGVFTFRLDIEEE